MRFLLVGLMMLLPYFSFASVQIIRHTPEEIILQIKFPAPEQDTLQIEGRPFVRLLYPEFQYNADQPGAPLLPFSIERVAIPPGASVSVSYQITRDQQLSGVDLMPAGGVYQKDSRSQSYWLMEEVYRSPGPYPVNQVEVSQPYEFRKMQVVRLTVYPIQYYPASRQVRIVREMTVRMAIQGGVQKTRTGRLTAAEEKFLKQKILNFNEAHSWVVDKPASFSKIQVNYDFSQGDWYKIPVENEGIYRVTGSFLRSQGIEINSIDIATIQMFNYGGAPLSYRVNDPRPQDLNEIAIDVHDLNNNGVLDDNDYILFYGRGVDGWTYDPNYLTRWRSYHHPYASVNYYIFTFNQNIGKRIQTRQSPQNAGVTRPTEFQDHYRFEEDRYNILASGLDWYWIKLQGINDQRSVAFRLPENITAGDMRLHIRFKGGSGSRYGDRPNPDYQYNVNVSLNGTNVITGISFRSYYERDLWQTLTNLRGGNNELLINYTGNQEGCYIFLDFFEVFFPRPFIAEGNYLKFNHIYSSSLAEFEITDFTTTGNRVWDVTDFANVREIIPIENGNTVRFQDSSFVGQAREYIAFGDNAIQAVNQLQKIDNSPNLRDVSRRGELLIILPDEFYDDAEPLEIFKESHFPVQFETERVTLTDIYREFSSCVQDVTAIRDFIRWAYFNWAVPPEYVLLLGDGSYDYKQIELKDYVNRVPTFEIAGLEEIGSRETDHFYVALGNNSSNLNDLDPWLALGRVPANSEEDIRNFIEKVKSYDQSFLINPTANGWQVVLTFVADDEYGPPGWTNEWFHLRDTESLIRNWVPRKFIQRKIYLTDYEQAPGGLGRIKPKATEDLLNQINRGTLMINFFGHGDPDTWAHEQVLVRSRDLPRIDNEGRLAFWIAATCDWGKFDDPNHNSMAEEMIWLPNKGGIGVISSSRPVYASSNAAFVNSFYRNLFNERSEGIRSRITGDALVQSLNGSQNDQKFRLLGDPTVQLADPEHIVRITSISPDTLRALATVTVQGEVINASNERLTDFQGDALIWVFDALDSSSSGGINYTYPGGTVFRGMVSVQDGQFEGRFIVPKSIKYKHSATGKLSVYAWSENLRDAVGSIDTLLFYGTESHIVDQSGPEIEFSFKDQPNFFDGDYVSRQPTVFIRLYDEHGINLTQEVGHRIELTIDDRIKKDVTEFFVYDKNSFQSGYLEYTLPPLSGGLHRLKITAWDNLNNVSSREISFRTSEVSGLVLDQVVNYPNPFTRDTYFTFQYQSPAGVGEYRIKIYTVSGRLIQELTGICQPGFNRVYWDGRDRDGDILANGVYLYKIIVDDGESTAEKIEKLAIVR